MTWYTVTSKDYTPEELLQKLEEGKYNTNDSTEDLCVELIPVGVMCLVDRFDVTLMERFGKDYIALNKKP